MQNTLVTAIAIPNETSNFSAKTFYILCSFPRRSFFFLTVSPSRFASSLHLSPLPYLPFYPPTLVINFFHSVVWRIFFSLSLSLYIYLFIYIYNFSLRFRGSAVVFFPSSFYLLFFSLIFCSKFCRETVDFFNLEDHASYK